jgi:Flp pilus assembly protein TadD
LSWSPKSGIIIDSLGWAHYRLGDMQRAADLLEQASDLAPDNAEIEYHLGAVYTALGRTDAARAQFRRALELSPELAPARQALEELEGDGGRR